jgi:hypothetical protein
MLIGREGARGSAGVEDSWAGIGVNVTVPVLFLSEAIQLTRGMRDRTAQSNCAA